MNVQSASNSRINCLIGDDGSATLRPKKKPLGRETRGAKSTQGESHGDPIVQGTPVCCKQLLWQSKWMGRTPGALVVDSSDVSAVQASLAREHAKMLSFGLLARGYCVLQIFKLPKPYGFIVYHYSCSPNLFSAVPRYTFITRSISLSNTRVS